jgi:hypothetical protein
MTNAEREEGMWNVIVLKSAPWIIGLLVGAGGNQFLATQALRDKVFSTAQRQEHIDAALAAERLAREEQDRSIREEMSTTRGDYLKTLDRISGRIDAIITQNTEVIQLIKIQQQVKP